METGGVEGSERKRSGKMTEEEEKEWEEEGGEVGRGGVGR